jgi:threonine synthase
VEVWCPHCSLRDYLTADRWRCTCGGAWEPPEDAPFDPALVDPADHSVWRYRLLYGLEPAVRLGAGWTPLLKVPLAGRDILLKLEYLSPTASFKDRGTSIMINLLAQQGVRHVVDDSSGNAGASVAAYAAAAAMQAEIYVPAHASAAKRAQIAVYGAQVREVPGPRENAKLAAVNAARAGACYASHAYHPGFLLGQQSVAWELWEQMGRRAPDWYVVPVGQGVHLLGCWLGFRRLRAAGLVERVPRLVAVQPERLAPVCRALEAGLDHVPAGEPGKPSVAEGLAISEPVRGQRLLQAIRESDGLGVIVDEGAILAAQQRLAHKGIYVEPTSAAAVAALRAVAARAAPADTIVVPLTGSGLKGSPSVPSE